MHAIFQWLTKHRLLLLSSALLVAANANAEPGFFDVAGFASFVYAKTLDGDEGTVQGISDEGSERDFNTLGIRLSTELDNKLSFTTQIVAEGEKDYQLEMEWMFFSYNLLPNLTLSIGKTRVPLFTFSDYLDVGYAYQWISPPYSVYGIPSFGSIDGAQLRYNFYLDDNWSSDLWLWAGRVDESVNELGGETLVIDNAAGIAWSVERNWLTLRAVYFTGNVSGDISGALSSVDAVAGFNTLAASLTQSLYSENDGGLQELINSSLSGTVDLSSVMDDLLLEKDPGEFLGLGTFLDFDRYFFAAEITRVEVDYSVGVGLLDSYYLMGGVRFDNDWTLSLTYAKDDDDVRKEILQNYDQQVAPFVGQLTAVDQAIDAVRTGLQQVMDSGQKADGDTYTFTARWDWHPASAVKLEYINHTIKRPDGRHKPQAVRLALDLVF